MGDIPGNATSRSRPESGVLSGFGRFARSVRFALKGIGHAWRSEPNFRIELGVAAAALALSLWLGSGTVAVLLATALVLAAELFNTAVEAIVDLVSPAHARLAGIAKDAAAGAVLLCALISVLIGLFALGPALLQRLGLS